MAKQAVLPCNNKYKPTFTDSMARYRDPVSGLWKRLDDWHMYNDKKLGHILRPQWQPEGDGILEDGLGPYYISNNSNKVYLFG